MNRRNFIKLAGLGCCITTSQILRADNFRGLIDDAGITDRPLSRLEISKMVGLKRILGKGTKIEISPELVESESYNTFTIRITLGEGGLAASDSIGIVCGSNIDRWQFGWPDQFWGQRQPWQTDNAAGDNYTTAQCSRAGANLSLAIGSWGGRKPYENEWGHFVRSLQDRLRFVLEVSSDIDLQENDVLTVTWGNMSQGSNGTKTPVFATTYYFLPFKYSLLPSRDLELPIRRGEHELLPAIRIKAHSATKFHVSAQPLLGAGEPFDLKISAIDQYCNPDENFTGTVQLAIEGATSTIPATIQFEPEDNGSKVVQGITIQSTGWYKITATQDSLTGISNYVKVSDSPGTQKIYFGDMHGHTLDCDACVPHYQHYTYARNVAGLDYVSVSAHSEYFGCKTAWQNYLDMAAKYNDPGNFVTFLGYEWAGGGHTNAYFVNKDDVISFYASGILKNYPPDSPPFRTAVNGISSFNSHISNVELPVFTLGHVHTDYSNGDDRSLCLYEMHSTHLLNSNMESTYQGLIANGKYYGVSAGGDAHRLPVGHLIKNPGYIWPRTDGDNKHCILTNGIQATFADKLSRKALRDGMRQRHTYGTNGERMVVLFDCNGKMMGDRFEIPTGENPTFNIEVGGTQNITEIKIWKYQGGWTSAFVVNNPVTDKWTGTWQDTLFSGSGIYYLRVQQSDGGKAWTSPIWITAAL